MALRELADAADRAATSMDRLAASRLRAQAEAIKRGQAPDYIEAVREALKD
jgi:hypothetical protein